MLKPSRGAFGKSSGLAVEGEPGGTSNSQSNHTQARHSSCVRNIEASCHSGVDCFLPWEDQRDEDAERKRAKYE